MPEQTVSTRAVRGKTWRGVAALNTVGINDEENVSWEVYRREKYWFAAIVYKML